MSSNKPYYVFITGGVVSSLGKGILTAALACLIQSRGFAVRLRKLDPYLNPDPGTMNPTEHGEVFVTDDGCEADLDLGHYERFTDVAVLKTDCITSGGIYSQLLGMERKGKFLGQTIQVIPHVTDEIKKFLQAAIGEVDFVFCEIGGTIGDIESLPFIEALRQFSDSYGRDRVAFIHLTLLPYLKAAKEIKTKPTQHSIRELRALGIQPTILVCRSEQRIGPAIKQKISNMTSIELASIISAYDCKNTIYEVPISYHAEGLDDRLLSFFATRNSSTNDQRLYKQPQLEPWHKIVTTIQSPSSEFALAIVGKYGNGDESYKSLVEAITHAAAAAKVKVNSRWVDSKKLTPATIESSFSGCSGILVPGGFGKQGSEGKILAAAFAQKQALPFLGICLGMHCAVIAFARNQLGLAAANSSEFDADCTEPVIALLSEWEKDGKIERRQRGNDLGGTMRLGAYPCKIASNSLLSEIYSQQATVFERHRHRYEINPKYRQQLAEHGLIFSGESPDGKLLEVCELKGHPWFFGVQYHPELLSRPFRPHPLYAAFVRAMLRFDNTKNAAVGVKGK